MAVNPSTTAAAGLRLELDRESGMPIAVQLRAQLTWLIATRALTPDDRLPSIRELASALDVHYHTVRGVYNQLRSDGLISVQQGLGARVRDFSSLQLARPSAPHVSGMIGVLIGGYDAFYLPFLKGVERVAADLRLLTTLCVTEDNPVRARIQIDQLVARGVSAIIATSVGQLVREELAPKRKEATIPIVYCDQPDQKQDSIVFDAPGAGYEMARHLASHGHRVITLITPSLALPNMAALHDGFRRAVVEGSIERVTPLIADGFSMLDGAKAAEALLSNGSRPTAIATAADALAFGVLATARKHRIPVPDELAIISYGEIDVAGLVEPALSTVALPVEEMGSLAAERLRERGKGNVAPSITILPTTLVVRQSCGTHTPDL
jgi:LacI family transcriptional regulator